MKIALGQINPVIGDFDTNKKKILDYIFKAKKNNADIIVFPEMCLCGYPPMDLLDYDTFAKENLKALRWIQHNIPEGIAAVVGYVDKNRDLSGKSLQNTASVIYNSEIIHTQNKTLLPTYDVFDEARYFEPAKERTVFNFKGKIIGIAICEDLWWEIDPAPGAKYPIDPVKDLLDQGASLILAPSASPFYSEKIFIRKTLTSKIGESSGVPVVYVNMVGGNDSLIFDGNSFVSSADGALIYKAKDFEEDFGLIDLNKEYSTLNLSKNKYDEIEKALVMGIKDYLDKCGFKEVHLGLSGGIDSALVLVLAVKALGADNVKAFGLPSRYSSDGSVTDSKKLAENLGIDYQIIEIENAFSVFLDSMAPHFKNKAPDLTEENIQARIRGLMLMAYSNKWGSLLLTTGNKSELATGYCTLYGDMCGSLGVIGDLFKTEVFDLCRYINRDKEIIPDAIITKPPSAELRPDQKDEDSLPPYSVLDKILDYYLIQNLTELQIVEKGFDKEIVNRILKLVGRSEYKRRQAPPVLKISKRAFGTGRRMPIARKIYEAEL